MVEAHRLSRQLQALVIICTITGLTASHLASARTTVPTTTSTTVSITTSTSTTPTGTTATTTLTSTTIPTTTLSFRILQTQPHQPKAFTQGWLLHKGSFYESSGLYKHSYLVRYSRDNTPEQRYTLPNNIFAEGLTLFNNELYLLSWQAGMAFVFAPNTLQPLRSYRYKGEGWGLTHNHQQLIMSNGSDRLQIRDPKTFALVRTLTVHGGGQRWQRLNELEFAKGLIWANIWQTSTIVAIHPQTGAVVGTLNLDSLVKANTQYPSHQALNGIAYDAQYDAFWVTGKQWPKRYLIKIATPNI